MAARLILTYPDSRLNIVSSNVWKEEDEKIETWIADLKDTLRVSNGIGLAAPQIGIQKRIFAIDRKHLEDPNRFGSGDENGILIFINPCIDIHRNAKMQKFSEACLSVQNAEYSVKRYDYLTLSCFQSSNLSSELRFTVSGHDATVIQHEFDHLDGILFIKKISYLDRKHFMKRFVKPKKEMTENEVKIMRDKNRLIARKERKKKSKK